MSQTVRVVPREDAGKGSWAQSAPVPLPGALVLPDDTAEQTDRGQLVASRWWLIASYPLPVTVRAQDLIEVDGLEPTTLRLHVHGALQTCADVHGTPHHVEGLLRRWEG